MISRKIRVLYFGTYRDEYTRNRVMITRMKRTGFEVVECHAPLWLGDADREKTARGGWFSFDFVSRVVRAYGLLLWRYFQIKDYDVLVVGYPGHFDIFMARFLSWLKRKPLFWDFLMSLYLIITERQIDKHNPFTAILIKGVEKIALRLPDVILIDTAAYRSWLCKTYALDERRFRFVPLGASSDFLQKNVSASQKKGCFLVVYYGTFIPNHGLDYIVEAVEQLQSEENIYFEIIGDGPERGKIECLVSQKKLNRVRFVQWLPKKDLIKALKEADVVLGSFGVAVQSLITVHNKIYEGLAMGKPVITGKSPALDEVFEHERHLYLVERANPHAIARAIRDLYQNPALCLYLGREGQKLVRNFYSDEHLSERIRDCIEEIVK